MPGRADAYRVESTNDTYCKWLRNGINIVFPNFELKSLTTAYAVVLLIAFIVTQSVYASNGNWTCTLYWSGARYTYAITRKGHIHRLILPLIYHAGFFHIFWNLFSLFQIGFSVHKFLGSWQRYLLLTFASGIMGNVVSGTISGYSIGVGASTSIFGMFGAYGVWLYYNWSALGKLKYWVITSFGLVVLFQFLDGFGSAGRGIDLWAHLGGFTFGALITFLIMPRPEEPADDAAKRKERKLKIIVIASLVILSITFITALFAQPLPLCDQLDCANIC